MKKQTIAVGGDKWLGVDPKYTDEQILAYVRNIYGWDEVHMDRQQSIVLVQPKVKESDDVS